jgi:hypothetical protein
MGCGLAVVAALSIAAASHAAPTLFRNGQIEVNLFGLDPVKVPPSAPLASGVLNATRNGDALQTLGVPAKVFSTKALSVFITDPGADPIDSVLLTVFNPNGKFRAGGGPEGGFGGPLPLGGSARVCLFSGESPCQSWEISIDLPFSVVGDYGEVTATFLADITVKGAPWTTGVISIPSKVKGAPITTFQQVAGGIAPTTAGDGSYLAVKLVTPIYIQTAITGSEVVPAWGVMSFEVPEPGFLALGLGAVGGLVLMGLRRRRDGREPAADAQG